MPIARNRIGVGLFCLTFGSVAGAQSLETRYPFLKGDRWTLDYEVTVKNLLPLAKRIENAQRETDEISKGGKAPPSLIDAIRAANIDEVRQYEVQFAYSNTHLSYLQRRKGIADFDDDSEALLLLKTPSQFFRRQPHTIYISESPDFTGFTYFPMFGLGINGVPLAQELEQGTASAPTGDDPALVYWRQADKTKLTQHVPGTALLQKDQKSLARLTISFEQKPGMTITFSEQHDASGLSERSLWTFYEFDAKSRVFTSVPVRTEEYRLISARPTYLGWNPAKIRDELSQGDTLVMQSSDGVETVKLFDWRDPSMLRLFGFTVTLGEIAILIPSFAVLFVTGAPVLRKSKSLRTRTR